MDNRDVEETKMVLEEDLKNNPHTIDAPLGHGVTYRKIMHYIYACILSGVSKADCVDWLYQLYNEQNDDEKSKFKTIIDSVAVAVYDFYGYLNMNKKNDILWSTN